MGVHKQTLQAGKQGVYPKPGQNVTVHYTGYLPGGSKFDSSYDRREPFKFQLGMNQVIRGWDEGLQTMAVGEKAILTISPDYAYGQAGSPGVIPPNATLIFLVELISIN